MRVRTMPKQPKPKSVFFKFKNWDLLPPHIAMPDEAHGSFEALLTAVAEALVPQTDYERLLVAQLSQLEWDIQRHAAMRDAAVRAQLRHVVVDLLKDDDGYFNAEKVRERRAVEYSGTGSEAEALAGDLASTDAARVEAAKEELTSYGIDLKVLLSRAHLNARGYDMHDDKILTLMGQRRRFFDDYQRIVRARKAMEEQGAA